MGIGGTLIDVERLICLAYYLISIPSSCGIFVYKLDTSIATTIVSLPIFGFSMELMKSVVCFM